MANPIVTSGFETLVGKNANLNGNLSCKNSVRIDGKFSGIIFTEQELLIAEGAVIKANVFAKSITIAGKVEGNVVAQELLQVLPTGTIIGDVKANNLSIETGATIRGNIGGLEATPAQQLPEEATE